MQKKKISLRCCLYMANLSKTQDVHHFLRYLIPYLSILLQSFNIYLLVYSVMLFYLEYPAQYLLLVYLCISSGITLETIRVLFFSKKISFAFLASFIFLQGHIYKFGFINFFLPFSLFVLSCFLFFMFPCRYSYLLSTVRWKTFRASFVELSGQFPIIRIIMVLTVFNIHLFYFQNSALILMVCDILCKFSFDIGPLL